METCGKESGLGCRSTGKPVGDFLTGDDVIYQRINFWKIILAPMSRMDYGGEEAKRKGSQETPDCCLRGQQLGRWIRYGRRSRAILRDAASPLRLRGRLRRVGLAAGASAVYVAWSAMCCYRSHRSQDDRLLLVFQVRTWGLERLTAHPQTCNPLAQTPVCPTGLLFRDHHSSTLRGPHQEGTPQRGRER